jgi:hypothetical protein
LIRHFAVCKRRNNDKGCLRCKRMLQLFRLHSLICDQPDSCRVPLCRYVPTCFVRNFTFEINQKV